MFVDMGEDLSLLIYDYLNLHPKNIIQSHSEASVAFLLYRCHILETVAVPWSLRLYIMLLTTNSVFWLSVATFEEMVEPYRLKEDNMELEAAERLKNSEPWRITDNELELYRAKVCSTHTLIHWFGRKMLQ